MAAFQLLQGNELRPLAPGQGRGVAMQVLGQVAGLDDLAPGHDDGPLDDVFQFPDVAGILVGHEPPHGFGGKTGHGLVHAPGVAGGERPGQKRNVLAAGGQRRHTQGDDV